MHTTTVAVGSGEYQVPMKLGFFFGWQQEQENELPPVLFATMLGISVISGFQAFSEAMMFAAGSMIAVKSLIDVLGISCFEKIGITFQVLYLASKNPCFVSEGGLSLRGGVMNHLYQKCNREALRNDPGIRRNLPCVEVMASWHCAGEQPRSWRTVAKGAWPQPIESKGLLVLQPCLATWNSCPPTMSTKLEVHYSSAQPQIETAFS